MKARYMPMAAILAAALAIDVSAQDGVTTTKLLVDPPRWPSNGIAERELGDDVDTWPENMFVELSEGRWTAWVLLSPVRGRAKALDFFSGEVQDVKVKNPGGYNDSFVDAKGGSHVSTDHLAFEYMDPRLGGGLGGIAFSSLSLPVIEASVCGPIYLQASEKISSDGRVLWRKVPLYKTKPRSNRCPGGAWASVINTAMDLRDGTLLVTGGKYVFHVRKVDMSPVGSAPNLHVMVEATVRQVIDRAKGRDIKDASDHLTEELGLR